MKYLTKLWMKLIGWKSIIGYLLLQMPFFAANPMIVDAFKEGLENPNAATLGNLIAQIILAVGLLDRLRRNFVK